MTWFNFLAGKFSIDPIKSKEFQHRAVDCWPNDCGALSGLDLVRGLILVELYTYPHSAVEKCRPHPAYIDDTASVRME